MVKHSWILLVAVMLTAAGCARQEAPSSSTPTQKALCVICVNHEIEVTDKTPVVEYQGERYPFCSEHCKTEFEKDPAKALATFAEKRAAATAHEHNH